MNTTIRLGIVVAGLVASTASCGKGQLILVLVAFLSTVSQLSTPEAHTIIGSGNKSSGWWCWKPWSTLGQVQLAGTCCWESISYASARAGPKMSPCHGCAYESSGVPADQS